MSDIYNRLVDHLAAGHEPTPEDIDELLSQLRQHLVVALKKAGIFSQPPRRVGIDEERWNEDALLILAHDAYLYIFDQRLTFLIDARAWGGNDFDLTGAVRGNLDQMLIELRQAADPVGRLVYNRLRRTVRELVAEGALVILSDGDPSDPGLGKEPRLRKKTVLSFAACHAPLTPREDLEEVLAGWLGALFPQLITADTRAVAKVRATLARKILALRDDGVVAFCFGDLANLLSATARRWHRTVPLSDAPLAFETSGEDSADGAAGGLRILVSEPDDEPDQLRRLRRLVRCVQRHIDLCEPPRDGQRLTRLFQVLRASALGNSRGPPPNNTALAKLLGVSRKTVPKLRERLQTMFQACLECLDRSAAQSIERGRKHRRGGGTAAQGN